MNKTLWIKRAIVAAMILATAVGFFFIGWAVKKFDKAYDVPNSDEYYIYMTFGTLPTLYASLHFFTHDKPTYVYFGRADTYDLDKTPDHVQPILNYVASQDVVADAAIDLIKDLEEESENAKYHFFVDDLRVMLAYGALLSNDVPADRFDITLLSDGTGSYGVCFTKFFLGEGGIDVWNTSKQEFNTLLEKYENHDSAAINDHGTMLYTEKYAILASQQPNVSYWMQFPDYYYLADNVSAAIKTEILKCKLTKMQPLNILNTLNENRSNAFFDAYVNQEEMDALFLNTTKPVLIISGTSLSGEGSSVGGGDAAFRGIINEIVGDFGGDYLLYFKPHPSWNPFTNNDLKSLNRQEFLEGLGITILPAQLPMEVLMWCYPNACIGGYSSSLYMATSKEQVKFFIGSLANPLNVLDANGFFADAARY